MLTFYLGTHHPHWLEVVDIPLFISHRRLKDRKRLPKARPYQYAIDSGGFTELSMFGEWRTTPREYVEAVARYDREMGHMGWAAPQDMMVEPFMLAKTGLDLATHQRLTVENFIELTSLWPQFSDAETPFVPVLQGQTLDDYMACWDLYGAHGVDISWQAVVGVGSVCRRQHTAEIAHIMAGLRERDPELPIHGFGVKTAGLAQFAHLIDTADSMAWSYHGRRNPPLPGCTGHINCANCLTWALQWRDRVLEAADGPRQLSFEEGAA